MGRVIARQEDEMQRYDLEETSTGYDSYRTMVGRDDGDWVKYEDYAALAERMRVLEEALRELLAATPQEECEADCDVSNCPWMQAKALLTQEAATLKAERDFFEERSQLRGDKERLVAMLDQLTSACWYNGREVGQPVLRAPDSHTLTCAIETVDSFAAPENKKWSSQDHRWEYEAQGLLEPEKLADGQDGPEDQAQTIAALTVRAGQAEAKVARLSAPISNEEWIKANYQQGIATGIPKDQEGKESVMTWRQFTTRKDIDALIASRLATPEPPKDK